MALELSEKTWKLGFTTGLGQEPRQRDIPARAVAVLEEEIRLAKERFGLGADAPVVSCYEAGRDGFWLHRCLLAMGVQNEVVDSSSIKVDRLQLGAIVGLTGSPYRSGSVDHEQGISKAGNRRMRAMAIEIAWGWLRFQPQSTLSRWYERRFAHGGKRLRRIGIVAVARKLLVALWKYLETGVPPEGAELSEWQSKLQYTPSLV